MEPVEQQITKDEQVTSAEGEQQEEEEAQEEEEEEQEEQEEEDMFGWEFRKLSRRRGREDALVTYEILNDALKELSNDSSEDNNVDYLAGFSVGVLKSFINQNMNQQQQQQLAETGATASANVDPDEWYKAYMEQFESLEECLRTNTNIGRTSGKAVKKEDEEDSRSIHMDIATEPISTTTTTAVQTAETTTENQTTMNITYCQYCGFLESQLGNNFVWGQTYSEWEAEYCNESNKDKKWTWTPINPQFADIETSENHKYNSSIAYSVESV